MKNDKITYRFVDRRSAKEQVEIFNKVFGVFGEQARLEPWIKKHYENPLTDEPHMVGAFDGEKLIGVNGFIEMHYNYKGMQLRLIQSCDTAVDPDYRGQGIFTGMIMYAEEQFKNMGFDAMIGFTNGNSHHGFMKMGWADVIHTGKLFLPATIPPVIKNMKKIRVPSFTNIGAWYLWRHIRHFAKMAPNYSVEIIEKVTVAEYQTFIRDNAIHFFPDQKMLDWKLGDLDGLYLVRKDANESARFIVTSYIYADGMRRANIICSSSSDNDEEGFTKAMATMLMRIRKKYDLVCIWSPYDSFKLNAAQKLGFLGNVVTKEGSPFIVRVLTENAQKRNLLSDKDNWKPTQIETDTMICLD